MTGEKRTEIVDHKVMDGRAWIQRDLTPNTEPNNNWRNALIEAPMIAATGTALTLTDITLDGAKSSYTSRANGGIVNVASGSRLYVVSGAMLQNSATTASGGAVYLEAKAANTQNGGTLTMTGGEIIGNTASGNGGAVYVAPNASMTMANEVLNGTVLRGTINGNTAANGAGVYLAWNEKDGYAILYLSGDPYFGGAGTEDAIRPQYDDRGAITNGNYRMVALPDTTTNGQQEYIYARQDIYMTYRPNPAKSIVVTGAIDLLADRKSVV